MSEYKKPLPVIQPWTEEFWKGAKQHKLLIQECSDCGIKIFYPRMVCPDCWSSNLGWSEASGRAKVYSCTITLAGVEKKFMEDLPYVLAMVDLEEGGRAIAWIEGIDEEEIKIGMALKLSPKKLDEDKITLKLSK